MFRASLRACVRSADWDRRLSCLPNQEKLALRLANAYQSRPRTILGMRRTCQHCARPFREGTGEGDFCCSGCRQVYELIGAEGLGDFYALQDQMGRPVGDVRDSAVDRSELSRLQRDAEQSKPEIHVRVDGMSCLGCVWLVERIAKAESGVVSARVSLQENRLVLGWRPGSFD